MPANLRLTGIFIALEAEFMVYKVQVQSNVILKSV